MAKYKICIYCKKEKHIAKFYRLKNTTLKGPDGRVKMCTECTSERRNSPNYNVLSKDYYLRKTYSISLADKNSMAKAQDYKCAMCSTHRSKLKQGLVVDHCHETGKVRKLLCSPCNVRLGIVENTVYLTSALKYLKQTSSSTPEACQTLNRQGVISND